MDGSFGRLVFIAFATSHGGCNNFPDEKILNKC